MNIVKRTLAALTGILISCSVTMSPTAQTIYAADNKNNPVSYLSTSLSTFQTTDQAAAYLRKQMSERNENISFNLAYSVNLGNNFLDEIMDRALSETGNGCEGDYLNWGIMGYSYGYAMKNNIYSIDVLVNYTTTAEQEITVSNEVSRILKSLDLDNKSDYEKLCSIYEYIVTNVSYTETSKGNIDYAAYGALFNKSAYCQGYSQLMYRMLLESGISARIIVGTGNNASHGWVIAELDGLYYNCDPTWDSNVFETGTNAADMPYFLRGSSDFDSILTQFKHERNILDLNGDVIGIDYKSNKFNTSYPMSTFAYTDKPLNLGDVNGDGKINVVDSTLILYAYSSKAMGGSTGFDAFHTDAADANHNGKIEVEDATIILNYYAYSVTGGKLSFDEFLKSKFSD